MPQNSLQLLLPFITAVAGVLGTILTYWLVGKRRLTLAHRQRIVEDKSVKFHQYAINYYMPVISSIGNFLWRLNTLIERKKKGVKKIKIENEDGEELSFFFFARYLSTENNVYKKMKTIFLRDRATEVVLGYLRRNIIESQVKGFSRNELSKVMKFTDPDELFTDFKPKLQKGGELREIFDKKYKPWTTQMQKNTSFIDFLHCYQDLFSFEINEVYTKSWYKENPVRLTSKNFDLIEREVLPELRRGGEINLKVEKKFLKKIRRNQ